MHLTRELSGSINREAIDLSAWANS